MNKLWWLCLLSLMACGDQLVSTTSSTTSIKITKYNPPKRLYVSFTDTQTGHYVDSLYISKRCSGCRDKTGQVLPNIIRYTQTYQKDDLSEYSVVTYDKCSIKRQLGGSC